MDLSEYYIIKSEIDLCENENKKVVDTPPWIFLKEKGNDVDIVIIENKTHVDSYYTSICRYMSSIFTWNTQEEK